MRAALRPGHRRAVAHHRGRWGSAEPGRQALRVEPVWLGHILGAISARKTRGEIAATQSGGQIFKIDAKLHDGFYLNLVGVYI